MRQEFPAIFCQKRDENEPKKEKKREKKGAKAKIFFFFSRGNNLHTKFCARRARAFRDSTTLVREHTHKNSFCAHRIRSKEKVRDATASFFRARFGRISLSPTKRARVDFSSRHRLFSLFLEREKKLEEHNTVLAFPIRAKRQRKRTQRRETRRKPTHIAASFARDERNVARFSSRRAFSLSPYRSRELERRVSSFRWALEGGRESESPLKKRRQKKEAKKSV